MSNQEAGLETSFWKRPRVRAFVLAFSVALIARALLVLVVVQVEGCTLSQYANSADGYQFKAVARGWLGDLDAVRSEEFFKQLVASGGLGSSHLLRFFPASSGPLALCTGAGFPEGPCSTFPAWIFSALAAGLAALWARDARVGVLVGLLPPVRTYTTTFFSGGWDLALILTGLMCVRGKRPTQAGLAFGLAAWSRPEALFPAAGTLIAMLAAKEYGRALRAAAGVAVAQLTLGFLLVWRFGSLLDEVPRGTSDGMPLGVGFLDVTGRGLALALQSSTTPVWKALYVVGHLVAALTALGVLVRRSVQQSRAADRLESRALATWLSLQLLLALSLRGSQGFDDLPRYLGLAILPIVVGLLTWLPRSPWAVAAFCVASVALALYPAMKNAAPECRGSYEAFGRSVDSGGLSQAIGAQALTASGSLKMASLSREPVQANFTGGARLPRCASEACEPERLSQRSRAEVAWWRGPQPGVQSTTAMAPH